MEKGCEEERIADDRERERNGTAETAVEFHLSRPTFFRRALKRIARGNPQRQQLARERTFPIFPHGFFRTGQRALTRRCFPSSLPKIYRRSLAAPFLLFPRAGDKRGFFSRGNFCATDDFFSFLHRRRRKLRPNVVCLPSPFPPSLKQAKNASSLFSPFCVFVPREKNAKNRLCRRRGEGAQSDGGGHTSKQIPPLDTAGVSLSGTREGSKKTPFSFNRAARQLQYYEAHTGGGEQEGTHWNDSLCVYPVSTLTGGRHKWHQSIE